MNEELKKLYDAIVSRGFYTKSYDEFVNQYQDPAYRDKVFDVVTREGLYTKGREEFDVKYAATGLKKKEPSVSTSQGAAMEQPMATGSSALPKSEGVSITTPTGQQATVQWGPTEFQVSQEAPMPEMTSLSDIVGQVDATIGEDTKKKISTAIGVSGAVLNKIINPQSDPAQAFLDAKKFADNTQAAYNVGALSAQISNNMADEVPDYERVAKLKQQLKNEQPKLLSSQLGAGAGDFFDMLAANPVTFLTEVLTTSAAQMTGGVGAMTAEDALYAGALGLTTGGFGASAYMSGKNSLNAEMSSRILDALEERGVDVTNAEQLREAMTNPELMMDVKGEVQAPATIVAALDAISAGLAGRFGKPLVELAIQAGAGAAGEAGAQLAAEGRITSPSAILTEMVAELPGGLIETAFGAKTKDIARKAKVNQEIKEIENELAATEDPEVRSVLETALNAKRNEKNKIFTDYADFVNSLPEEEVARLNALNEEIVKVSNAINSVTSEVAGKALRDRRQALLDEVAKIEETATQTQDAVQDVIASLNDEELISFNVESLEEIPEQFRDRAVKKDGVSIEIREKILGLPIGKKTNKVLNEGYTYTLTGKEAKDYALQEQATDEGVLRPEQPEVGLQEVVEGDQEPQVTAEEGVEEKVTYEAGTIGTLLNERVSYSDPVSGETVEGDLFVDGQRVVLEAAGGRQFDLGNVDEVLGLNIEEAALVAPAEMAIIPQEDGSFVFNKEGNQKVAKGTKMFNRQPGLQAIRRDAEGNVDRVTMYSEDGAETYNLTGQEAEDAAYYIVRGFVETQEGQDAINQLAQRNEEARRDLSQPLGSRAVQQAAPQAPAPVRAEAPAGPAVEAAVEDDIQAQEVADLAAEMQAAAPTTVERLNRIAERARKAISKITPDVKIIVHDTDAAYREASGDTEQGVYVPATKTIHINASKATPGAVAHEVFHAVFLDRVKTDVAAQRAAKKMVESLKRVVGEDSELYQYLDAFSQDYDANFQNEEKLAELAAVLAENYMGLETSGLSKGAIASFKQAVKDFINTIAKRFGIPMPSTITDADVIATLNAIAQKTVTGEVITEADVMAFDVLAQEAGVSQPIGEPSEINALPKRNRKEAKFSKAPMPLSFVTSADKVDIEAVIKDAQEKNLKVWFWMADQLGRGEYYDENINGTHYLDAGPSFALDPQNRDKGVLWASGLQRSRLEAMVEKADLIFFISGSPQKAKLFNKKMVSIIEERVNAKGGFQKFKADVLAASNKKGVTEPLRSFNSFEDMRNSTERKNFIIEMLDVQTTPTTELFKVLTDYGVFFDPNELRDGFYLENGFEANDIMLIGKPTGIGGKAAHSTYETEILGEVIGVPDKVVNAWDVMPQSVKDKYVNKKLSTTQKTKIISPDAGTVYTPEISEIDSPQSLAIRQRRGLINVTEREATKYAKIGINDQRVMQAMEDIGLAGVKFTKGDVEAAIKKAFDDAIDDINSSNMYKGESVVITQDSPGITRAIEAEIATLEEQGASVNRIEQAKRTLDNQSARNQYIQEYQNAQLQTLSQWTSYLSQSNYDPAFKLMMLDAVVTNNYDSNTKKYIKRDSKTIRNITPFDAGTLAQLYGMTDSKELLKTYVEIQADNAENIVKANEMKSTKDGKWLKFNGGKETPEEERAANATALSQLVQDTPWCTKTNASSQLNGGDFYVYATKATDGRYIPRVAVRMDGDNVGELRGVASSKQDLEPEMLPVAEKFLREEIPNDSGKKWLDSVEYNKRVKAYTEEILGRKVTMDDFKKYGEIKADETKYSVDYGGNGFVERLNQVIRTKVVANDLSADLVGRVELSPSSVNKDTRILFGDVRNLDERNMSDYVGLEMIMGDARWESPIKNFPPNLKTITGKVTLIDRADSIGNIEVIGGELELRTDYIKTLGNLKSARYIDIDKAFASLEDLGNLEEINVMYGISFLVPKKMTSLGKVKRVNGSISLDVYSKLESFGDLEYISRTLNIYSDKIKSLGKIKTVGGSLRVVRSSQITSLGSVEYVGGPLNIDESNIKDIPNLKHVGESAFFPYGIKSISGIYFGKSVSYHNGTKGPSVKKINGDLSVWPGEAKELTDLGDVEEVTRDISVNSASSLGNVKIVGRNLGITGRNDGKGVTSIEKLEQVGRDLIIYSAVKINSFGSINSIGGNINAPKVTELGSLQSVGQNNLMEKPFVSDGLLLSGAADATLTNELVNSLAKSYINEGAISESIEQQIKDLYIKNVYDFIGVEMPPQIRQRKGSPAFENWSATPKSGAQKLGHMYNMNHKGFAPKTIDPMHFKRDVERLDKRLSVRKTTLGTGYYMTLDGKFFNPYERVIGGNDGDANGLRQRINSQTANIFDIVETARAKGYTDKTIELYLKQEGFDAAEIKNALAVASGLNGAEVPVAFGYVEGGMPIGQSLFSEIQEKLNKLTSEGADKATIRVEAQRLLMDSDVYKAQSEDVQAQLRLSLDASIGTNAAARAFSQEFKELRAMLSAKKRSAKELNAIKAKVRGFIRKNLPQGEYSKADVVKLLKAIVDANVDSLPLVIERVENYVTEYKVRTMEKNFQKLLATKTTRMDAGRLMGRTTVEVQEALAALPEMLVTEDMAPEKVAEMLNSQQEEFNNLASSYELTDESISRMQLLQIAMLYNEAALLENNEPVKLETLERANAALTSLILLGRQEFKAMVSAQHEKYKGNVAELIKAITGNAVPDDINTREGLDRFVNESEVSRENKEATKGRIAKAWGSFIGKPFISYFDKSGSLHTLLSRITANLTDQFGGPVHRMVYDTLKLSGIEFERRMQMNNKMLDAKGREIFGEDYDNAVKNNKIAKPIDIFKDEARAKAIMNEMKTASSARKSELNNELNSLRVLPPMSQNQIYYLYNQYKDPANRGGFESKFGKNYAELMNRLFEESLDPKVREWADWQVDVMYPMLYNDYNPVYRNIFRTNMPWNANYAGRMYREFEDGESMAISLMNDKGQFSNIQTPSSTKLRKANKNKIRLMDGDMVLSSYLGDMEYFRAYGETIRDIDKMFKNPAVRESIKKTAGEDVLKLIDENLKLVGTRGMSVGTNMKQSMLDRIASRFSKAVLMANPSQFIKQATSMFAFANRIGFENWTKYTAKAAPNMKSLWGEFIENAPRIQKRYNTKELTAIIGTYKPGRTSELMPKDKNGNPILRKGIEAYDKVTDALMWPVIQGDKFSAMAGAMGNYLYYKEQFAAKNPNATEQEVITFAANKVSTEIEQTLGSADVIDKDYFQNSGNALYRAFSVLQNAPKAMVRQLVPAYSGFFKKLAKMDKTAGQGTLKQNLETIFLYQFLVPMLFQYAALGFPGLLREWRDEDDEEMGMAALLGPFTALFFVGDMLSAARDLVLDKPWATDARTAPGWDILSDASKAVKKIASADTDDELYEALGQVGYSISSAAGLGLKNISRMAQNIADVIDDGIDDGESVLRLLNYSDYTIEGPDKKKK